MSENTPIDATLRSRVGKGSARAARRAGRIPAVIYGDKQAPLSIEMEGRVIRKVIPVSYTHLTLPTTPYV